MPGPQRTGTDKREQRGSQSTAVHFTYVMWPCDSTLLEGGVDTGTGFTAHIL